MKGTNGGVMVVVLVISLGFVVMVGATLLSSIRGIDSSLASMTLNFGVSNPSVDRDCVLHSTPDPATPITVRYYNGYTWSTLTVTTDYELVGNTVTVFASAMD